MVANLKDTVQSWYLQPDHSYRRASASDGKFSAHDYFRENPSLSGMGKAIEGKEFPLLLKE